MRTFGLHAIAVLLWLTAATPASAKTVYFPGSGLPGTPVSDQYPCPRICGTGPPDDSGGPPPCCLQSLSIASHGDYLEMSGSEMVPSNPSLATGFGTAVVDAANNQLVFKIRHTVSGELVAAIHGPAEPGQTAPALFVLPPGAYKTGTWNYPESMQKEILLGKMYVSISSSTYPNGEIRDQIELSTETAPSLTTWGMLALATVLLGSAAMLLVRRREDVG